MPLLLFRVAAVSGPFSVIGMSKVSLKQLAAPCILYNLNGYYDHLKALLAHMIDMGLSTPERQEGIYFAETLDDIRAILKI